MSLDLFASLNQDTLRALIEAHRNESLTLDFKTAQSTMTRDDRVNLAKALSGFANSAGGVVVWGVQTTRSTHGDDCASALVPIAPLSRFIAQLNEFTGDVVSPVVDGVLHRGIPFAEDCGAAITLVPPSDSGPHMAKQGEDRYFKRAGSRFARLEHFDIEDMFGRRPRPILVLTAQLARGGTTFSQGVTTQSISVSYRLENQGRGSAVAPYVRIVGADPPSFWPQAARPVQAERFLPLVSTPGSAESQFIGGRDSVLHPGVAYEFSRASHEVQGPADIAGFHIMYDIAAENLRLERRVLAIPASSIRELLPDA